MIPQPWQLDWLDASFRGVPFKLASPNWKGGRRVDVFEFPYRDKPDPEDLGRRARRYRIRAYVIGPTYNVDRDNLVAAMELDGTPGVLTLPYIGHLLVQPLEYDVTEDQQAGGRAIIDLQFVEASDNNPTRATIDTAAAILLALDALWTLVTEAFVLAYLVRTHPSVLIGLAAGVVGALAAPYLSGLGLSPVALAAIEATPFGYLGGLNASPSQTIALASDPAGMAAAFTGAAAIAGDDLAASAATASAVVSPPGVGDVVSGIVSVRGPAADWTAGLATAATAGANLPAVTGTTPTRLQQAANQAALVELAQASATIALLQVLSAFTFATSADAQGAMTLVTGLIDARLEAAAAMRADALYRAWLGMRVRVLDDLETRILSLPTLSSYQVAQVLPATALAARLYQDGARADELVQLNGVRHPGFMPSSGLALAN